MSRPSRTGPRGEGTRTIPFPGLALRTDGPPDRPTFWTRGLGDPPQVYGERLRFREGEVWRAMDPLRSKLAAALSRGYPRAPVSAGARVLYLGGGSGTTVSHMADLVGRAGRVYAVEKSPRPFAKLLEMAERYPNVYPILGDVRSMPSYAHLLPPADHLYADVSQAFQGEIVRDHAQAFLRPGGTLWVCLKVPSLPKGKSSGEQVRVTQDLLRPQVRWDPPLGLEPFHKGHTLLSGVMAPQRAA